MFESLPDTPPDAILGLNEAFLADPNPRKVNLTVGVYVDEAGTTPVLPSVKQAERRIWEHETTKSYLNIAGNPQFCQQVTELVLDPLEALGERAYTLQTPGGSGALRVTADFIAKYYPQSKVWVSQPTWPNHPSIFQAAGVAIESYPYYARGSQQLQLDEMFATLSQAAPGDFVLLHACCHNPTGTDPDAAAWEAVADHLRRRRLIPIVDSAYQGFGVGLDQDRQGTLTLAQQLDEMLICSSFSKTFGLYRERTGALTILATDGDAGKRTFAAVKQCVRRNYSNPPSHGGAIVATILSDSELRQQWQAELDGMRSSIRAKRRMFVEALSAAEFPWNLEPLHTQQGMFSLLELSPEAVDALREQFAVYLVRDGRMNLAALNTQNLDYVIHSLQTVSITV